MVPTQFGLVYSFYSRRPLAKISASEISALNYLQTQTPINSRILVPPFNKYQDIKDPTPPVWAWSDSSYVASFSNRLTFFADQEQVDIMGYDFHPSQDLLKQVFETTDIPTFIELAEATGANYLYFPKAIRPKIDLSKTKFKRVFENNAVEVWQFDP